MTYLNAETLEELEINLKIVQPADQNTIQKFVNLKKLHLESDTRVILREIVLCNSIILNFGN